MYTLQINLQPKVEQRVKFLIGKYKNKELFFKDFISYKISELEKSIYKIEKDLRKYEKQYQMSSLEFFQLFENGKYGDEDDYMIWSGLYEFYQKNKNELAQLQW